MNFKLTTDVEKNPGPAQNNTNSHKPIIKPVMQSDSSSIQLVSSMNLMLFRLRELGLETCTIDVGGAGDCFFRSISHQLCGNNNHHMQVRSAGVHPDITQRDLLRAIYGNFMDQKSE